MSAQNEPLPRAIENGVCIADRYVVEACLGTGGMSAVYRAFDRVRDETVALKRLQIPSHASNPRVLRALFEREFHTLVRLAHPHIVSAHDFGEHEGCPFYTMELLEGENLEELAPLPYPDVCRIARDVASALAFLHAHRVVHRDVSPRNVHLANDGRAKLLDFGALSTFGAASELAGTLMSIAPESLQRASLDQRTDLFALAALAYWALTQRMPYEAQTLEELPQAWLQSPAAPSTIVPGAPAALDALLLSMLKPDPSARPANAAIVIDRLTTIADLPDEDERPAAESYLLSSRMVGRRTEREWILPKLLRALDGSGAAISIEGSPGIGRSRMLREVCLDAQLKAMVALSADAQAIVGSYAVPIHFAEQLLSIAPAIACECAREHAALLSQLSPQLARSLAAEEPPAVVPPTERRARYRSALHAWFMQVAERLPLVLAVDNLHAADDDSAAVLAGLAREAHLGRLIVITTVRSGEAVISPDYVTEVRRHSDRLKLTGLTRADCEELTGSMFGDVAHSGRTARYLFEHSAGNPALAMDLARLMVRKGIARYASGTWILPLEISRSELPSRARDVLAARLGELSPKARTLAEAMCIHDKPLPLEACAPLEPELSEADVYAALDELVAAQVLASDGTSYRFEQVALRNAFLDQLDVDRRRKLHTRAAQALVVAADTSDASSRVEAAWHLLRAGDEIAGADLMARGALEFLHNDHAGDSLERVVEGIEAALDVYDRQGRSDYEIARLMLPLVPLAYYTDRRVCLKYGERALKLGLKITGLRLAQGLTHGMSAARALKVAMLLAEARFARQRARGIDYDLNDAINWLCGLVPSALSAPSVCYETETVARMVDMLAPLRLFGPGHIGTLMADWARVQLLIGQGREWEARELLAQWESQFDQPSVREALGIPRWELIWGGVLFSRGMLGAYTLSEDALRSAAAMEELGVRLWIMGADQIRLLYHALRGESERVSHFRSLVELHAVQGNAMWQAETFWPALMISADALTKDSIATRATWEQLARRAAEVPALRMYAQAAEAIYLQTRGEHARALAIYARILPELTIRGRVSWAAIRTHYAEALLTVGDPGRAKVELLELLSHVPEREREMAGLFLESQRQLALAECALGNTASAAAMLEELLQKHGDADQPLLVGLLHKARAEVALRELDAAGFEHHSEEMGKRFGSTGNPALIAQCERLSEAAANARSDWDERVSRTSYRAAKASASLHPKSGPVARFDDPDVETRVLPDAREQVGRPRRS